MRIAPIAHLESLVLDPFVGRVALAPIAPALAPTHMEPLEALVTGSDLRKKLDKLDAAILAEKQVEMPLTHRFARGVYAREAFIPKGTVVTGRVHKYSQINILLKGEISILTENGLERLSAPVTIVSPPGTKRAAYAHEDVIWTTICGTGHTDLETMEDVLACRTFEEYEAFCQQQKELTCQSL